MTQQEKTNFSLLTRSPKVWGIKTNIHYKAGDEAIVISKYNKEISVIIYNNVTNKLRNCIDKDGEFNFYSCVRLDGLNRTEYLKKKVAKKLEIANRKYQQSLGSKLTKQEEDFLSSGEPIKVGHHSEKRHRKLIKKAQDDATNMVKLSKESERYEETAANIEIQLKRETPIDNPDCLNDVAAKLEAFKKSHKLLLDNKDLRKHSYDLAYSRKKIKDLEDRYKIAQILWQEESQQTPIQRAGME